MPGTLLRRYQLESHLKALELWLVHAEQDSDMYALELAHSLAECLRLASAIKKTKDVLKGLEK